MNYEFVEAMIEREDSLEAWRKALEAIRERTALGPHDIELADVDGDRIVLEMPMGDHARQVVGLLHGGVSALLAETAASMHACWGVDLTRRGPVGIELNATHLRSATDGTIRSVGKVLRRGATHVQHRVEIRHLERGEVLTECRVINYLRPHDGSEA